MEDEWTERPRDVREAVHFLLELRVPPIPIERGKKKPAIGWKGLTSRRPTEAELEKFKEFWERSFEEGIEYDLAIPCGKVYDLLVVDLDVREGKNGLRTFLEMGVRLGFMLPKGVTMTPSGGCHIPYKWRDGLGSSQIAPGIDILSNHLVKIPPTPGYRGSFWMHFDSDPMPRELYHELLKMKRQKQIKPVARKEFVKAYPEVRLTDDFLEIISEYWVRGQRQALALSLAGYLCKAGKDEEEVLRLISTIARRMNDEEVDARLRAVRETYRKAREGGRIKGYLGLPIELQEFLSKEKMVIEEKKEENK